jgi:hypothetical protein
MLDNTPEESQQKKAGAISDSCFFSHAVLRFSLQQDALGGFDSHALPPSIVIANITFLR